MINQTAAVKEDLKPFPVVWTIGTKSLAKCTRPQNHILPQGERDTEEYRVRERQRVRYQYLVTIYNFILR